MNSLISSLTSSSSSSIVSFSILSSSRGFVSLLSLMILLLVSPWPCLCVEARLNSYSYLSRSVINTPIVARENYFIRKNDAQLRFPARGNDWMRCYRWLSCRGGNNKVLRDATINSDYDRNGIDTIRNNVTVIVSISFGSPYFDTLKKTFSVSPNTTIRNLKQLLHEKLLIALPSYRSSSNDNNDDSGSIDVPPSEFLRLNYGLRVLRDEMVISEIDKVNKVQESDVLQSGTDSNLSTDSRSESISGKEKKPGDGIITNKSIGKTEENIVIRLNLDNIIGIPRHQYNRALTISQLLDAYVALQTHKLYLSDVENQVLTHMIASSPLEGKESSPYVLSSDELYSVKYNAILEALNSTIHQQYRDQIQRAKILEQDPVIESTDTAAWVSSSLIDDGEAKEDGSSMIAITSSAMKLSPISAFFARELDLSWDSMKELMYQSFVCWILGEFGTQTEEGRRYMFAIIPLLFVSKWRGARFVIKVFRNIGVQLVRQTDFLIPLLSAPFQALVAESSNWTVPQQFYNPKNGVQGDSNADDSASSDGGAENENSGDQDDDLYEDYEDNDE